jgi:hypothetical protein
MSIPGGLDNPLVEVEHKGRRSNFILTTQGDGTLKIFHIPYTLWVTVFGGYENL